MPEYEEWNASKTEPEGLPRKIKTYLWKTFCFPFNLKFVFIRTFYFAFYGGLGCILPFTSLYFKQIGLTPMQIGWIWGVKPVMTLIGAPLWGAIGDGYQISRILLVGSLVCWVGVYIGVVFIPTPRRHYSCSVMDKYQNSLHNFIMNYTTDEYNNITEFATDSQHSDLNPYNRTNWNSLGNYTERVLANTDGRGGNDIVDNTKESLWWLYDEHDTKQVFIMVLVMVFVGEFFTSPATALADAGTTQTLGGGNMEYFGSQRAWGPVGFACSSALVGCLISKTRASEVFCGVTVFTSGYTPMLYALVGCMAVSIVCATQMKFKRAKHKDPEKSLIIDEAPEEDFNQIYSTIYVVKRFMNVYYGSWLLTAVFAGMCNGIVSGFLYWHMDNLGADQMLIGMASVTVSITEFLAFFLVRNLTKLLSHAGVIYLSLFLYIVRFIIYGAVTDPTYILIAEVFRGLAYSSIWVSMVTFTSDILPESCYATLQGIILGLHLGLGSGTGQLIGGILVHYFGAPMTFYIFGAATVVYLIIFALCQTLSTAPATQYKQFENPISTTPSEPD